MQIYNTINRKKEELIPLKEGVVNVAPYGPAVQEDTKKLVEEARGKISGGNWDIFTGPLKGQDGTIKVPEGQKLTDKDLLSMDWFVQGVEGALK